MFIGVEYLKTLYHTNRQLLSVAVFLKTVPHPLLGVCNLKNKAKQFLDN